MVSSVLKAIQILEALGNNENLGVTELSRNLGFPKSSVHSILETLASEGLVEKVPETSKYHLGLKLIELGNRAQLNLDICKISHPYLKNLNKLTDETVHLTVLDNIRYGLRFQSHKRGTAPIDELVDRLNLDHLLQRHPETLSGGEQQRVALARAIAGQRAHPEGSGKTGGPRAGKE